MKWDLEKHIDDWIGMSLIPDREVAVELIARAIRERDPCLIQEAVGDRPEFADWVEDFYWEFVYWNEPVEGWGAYLQGQ